MHEKNKVTFSLHSHEVHQAIVMAEQVDSLSEQGPAQQCHTMCKEQANSKATIWHADLGADPPARRQKYLPMDW